MGAGEDDLQMWQKLVIGEISQEQFNQWLKDCDQPFTELHKSINNYGLERTLKLKFKLISDVEDSEFNKLLKYYKQHYKLLINYIENNAHKEIRKSNENN